MTKRSNRSDEQTARKQSKGGQTVDRPKTKDREVVRQQLQHRHASRKP